MLCIKGVRFPCDRCTYAASSAYNLKHHVRNLHEGLKFNCALCDFRTARATRLKKHVLLEHENQQNSGIAQIPA
jgi:hypothetical protein